MMLGLDIASVDENKDIDWLATKAMAGPTFAFIRGAYGTWIDPTWKAEADRARKAGFTVGAYLFPLPGPQHPSAKEQVAAFAAACRLGPRDFPPVLDVEFPHGVTGTGLNRDALCQWLTDAIVALRDCYGAWPMIYTSTRVWDGADTDCLDAPMGLPVKDVPLWLAKYPWKTGIPWVANPGPTPAAPKAWGGDIESPWFHQYQGDARQLPGFSSTVDMNVFMMPRGGERVMWVQRRLKITETGQLDGPTVLAIKAFQSFAGLVPDGQVGVKTFAALSWK